MEKEKLNQQTSRKASTKRWRAHNETAENSFPRFDTSGFRVLWRMNAMRECDVIWFVKAQIQLTDCNARQGWVPVRGIWVAAVFAVDGNEAGSFCLCLPSFHLAHRRFHSVTSRRGKRIFHRISEAENFVERFSPRKEKSRRKSISVLSSRWWMHNCVFGGRLRARNCLESCSILGEDDWWKFSTFQLHCRRIACEMKTLWENVPWKMQSTKPSGKFLAKVNRADGVQSISIWRTSSMLENGHELTHRLLKCHPKKHPKTTVNLKTKKPSPQKQWATTKNRYFVLTIFPWGSNNDITVSWWFSRPWLRH